MQDRFVAIDLEWKPEFLTQPKDKPVPSPVAVIQLASSTVCLLIHVSAMSSRAPPELKEFLCSPDITLVRRFVLNVLGGIRGGIYVLS